MIVSNPYIRKRWCVPVLKLEIWLEKPLYQSFTFAQEYSIQAWISICVIVQQ